MLKKTSERLRRWCDGPRGPRLVLVMGIIIVAAALLGTGNAVLSATGTEKFCTTSCHEMSHNNEEYKGTIHDVNRTGVRATCVDCHTPKQGLPYYVRKLYAVQELWGHYVTHSIDTKEKFEARRYELAVRVWTYMKKSNSRACSVSVKPGLPSRSTVRPTRRPGIWRTKSWRQHMKPRSEEHTSELQSPKDL